MLLVVCILLLFFCVLYGLDAELHLEELCAVVSVGFIFDQRDLVGLVGIQDEAAAGPGAKAPVAGQKIIRRKKPFDVQIWGLE